MANEKNLKPKTMLSSEEAKSMGRKGGKKSAEVRRQKKMIKEQLELLLSLPLKNDKLKTNIKKLGIGIEEIDNQMALVISMYQKALKGDTKAFEIIRDTVGEKPIERQEIAGELPIVIKEDIEEEWNKK